MRDPTLEPCRIYVHTQPSQLAPGQVPKNWIHNQYAVELWLQRALRDHAWRVTSVADADLVVVAANFSLYCDSGKSYRRRVLWDALMDSSLMRERRAPAFVPLQYAACPEPWLGATPRQGGRPKRPDDMLLLLDVSSRAAGSLRQHGIVSPFVVSKPPSLVDDRTVRLVTPAEWATRRLMFFAGHVPKLVRQQSPRLFRALHIHARVCVTLM